MTKVLALVGLIWIVGTAGGCLSAADADATAQPDATVEADTQATATLEADAATDATATSDATAATDAAVEPTAALTPTIAMMEAETVIPQTTLHLSAGVAEGAPVGRYEWTATQPTGSMSLFLPNANAPEVTFEVNVAGEYVIELVAFDEDGAPSAVVAKQVVLVVPDAAIHVELLWRTPGDENETDTGFTLFGESVGSDMDLHFVQVGMAEGLDIDGVEGPDGWFDTRYDCFWQNNAPTWGASGEALEPTLDRDDTDSAGPENTNVHRLDGEHVFAIGAHYWDDWGYGVSYATVRVYIYGDLVYEKADVQMVNRDMWEVGTIAWPGGEVTAPDEPRILRNYWNDADWGP